MLEPTLPANEPERLAVLHGYRVLDTPAEQGFDDLTQLAAEMLGTPVALVSLIDAGRQWFKSKVGLDASETERRVAFCAHAILRPSEVLVVPDATLDRRFADNPLVVGPPNVRAYAGAPLVVPTGEAIGTLCAIDHAPREFTPAQLQTLTLLARQVVSQLELRKTCRELADAADEVTRAKRAVESFNYMAAHDLQEPLRKLTAFGGLLRTDLGVELNERAEKDLSFIEDAAARMRTLIEDLLALARAGNRVDRQRISLEDCVSDALESLALRVRETGATIETDELPTVAADRMLLTQLFQNLISNAIKFAGDDAPRVEVTATSQGEGLVVCVRDHGIGIDPQHAKMVFEPFRRLHGRSAYQGTGIGLAIAAKAVECHGGRIWVEPADGGGCRFLFTLPHAAAVSRETVGAG